MSARPGVKCVRPNCPRKAKKNGQNKGLCEAHYNAARRGYVDATPVRERLIALNEAGFTWRTLAKLTGKTVAGLLLVRDGTYETVQIDTSDAVLAIPLPRNRFTGNGLVSSLGTQRRIQALMALGWPQTEMATRIGLPHDKLSKCLTRPMIQAHTARAVDGLFEALSSTRGPSNRTRIIAARKGYAPPLAWDDIDDPYERPELGASGAVPFPERYAELRHHLGLSDAQIAERQGVQLESLHTQLRRYGLSDRRTA